MSYPEFGIFRVSVSSIFAASALWLAMSGQAAAGQTGSSSGDLTFQRSEHVNSARGGSKVVTRTVTGVSHAKDKGGPLDEAEIRCYLTFVAYKGRKGTEKGSGYCVGIGSKGNTWEMLLSGDGKGGGTWKFVDGTGRYDSIKGSGNWQHKGSKKDKNERYEWTGQWELKN